MVGSAMADDGSAFADDSIALLANDEFCRLQRIQAIAFPRIWSWYEAAAAFERWIWS